MNFEVKYIYIKKFNDEYLDKILRILCEINESFIKLETYEYVELHVNKYIYRIVKNIKDYEDNSYILINDIYNIFLSKIDNKPKVKKVIVARPKKETNLEKLEPIIYYDKNKSKKEDNFKKENKRKKLKRENSKHKSYSMSAKRRK